MINIQDQVARTTKTLIFSPADELYKQGNDVTMTTEQVSKAQWL